MTLMSAHSGPSVREPRDFSGTFPEVWERYMVPAVFVPWTRRLLDATGVRPGDRVLDVACATGTVARLAAQRLAGTGHVTGVDLDKAFLAVARKASRDEGARIDWHCGNASSLPFSPGSFDVVLCQQGIQFFDDRESAVREMHRVLDTRGRLGVSVFRSIDRSPGYGSLATALGRHLGPRAEALTRRIFSLGDPEALRSLLQSAGFQRIDVRPDVGDVYFLSAEDFPHTYAAGWEAPPAATEAIIHEVVRDLRGYCDADGLTFPMETLMATAQK